jgi:hypothetical protein
MPFHSADMGIMVKGNGNRLMKMGFPGLLMLTGWISLSVSFSAWGMSPEYFDLSLPIALQSRAPMSQSWGARSAEIVPVKGPKDPFYFLSNLQGVNFGGGNFDNANFTGANLQQTLFQRATFRNANLFLANLQKANLNEANMEGTNLTGANLQGATLHQVNLEHATLLFANLQETNLLLANLQGAYLANANIRHANLRGANLSTAVGLTQDQLNLACVDDATILPPSLYKPSPCLNY